MNASRFIVKNNIKLLRIAEPEIVPPLTKLYSLSVEKGKVFDQWKTAHLCPVFKKDDPTDFWFLIKNYY